MPNFWQLATTPILKIQLFHLTAVDFELKSFLMLYLYLENTTTGIAIITNLIHTTYIKTWLNLATPQQCWILLAVKKNLSNEWILELHVLQFGRNIFALPELPSQFFWVNQQMHIAIWCRRSFRFFVGCCSIRDSSVTRRESFKYYVRSLRCFFEPAKVEYF